MSHDGLVLVTDPPKPSRVWGVLGALAPVAGTVLRPWRLAPGLAGAGLVAYGASLVYLPAGFVAGGAFLLWFGMEINRVPKPPPPDDGMA